MAGIPALKRLTPRDMKKPCGNKMRIKVDSIRGTLFLRLHLYRTLSSFIDDK